MCNGTTHKIEALNGLCVTQTIKGNANAGGGTLMSDTVKWSGAA